MLAHSNDYTHNHTDELAYIGLVIVGIIVLALACERLLRWHTTDDDQAFGLWLEHNDPQAGYDDNDWSAFPWEDSDYSYKRDED